MDGGLYHMHFLLRAEGMELPCKSFQNFEQESEYETIQEGGLNDRVHIRPKPALKPAVFKIERYLYPGYQDPFAVGQILTEDAVLMISARQGDFTDPQIQFLFSGCVVTEKSYSGGDAEKSGLLIETTTIAYEYMTAKWKGAQR